MHRTTIVTAAGLGLAASLIAAPLTAAPLPETDGSAPWGNDYHLAYSAGDLYLHTGDSIYLVDDADRDNITYQPHMTDLELAFDGDRRWFEGSFAADADGHAMMAVGFTDRGLLSIDLTEQTSEPVEAFDNDNIFSLAGRSEGHFYAMWADPDFLDPESFTRIYHVGPDHEPTFAFDPAPGDNSGGLAFTDEGDLIVSTYVPTGGTTGTNHFFRVAADDLAAFEADGAEPAAELIAEIEDINGTSTLVTDRDGLIFFNTVAGIGYLDPHTGETGTFKGDVAVSDLSETVISGLAYDADRHELAFAQLDGATGDYHLQFAVVPEPSTAALLAAAGLALTMRRRRR